MTCTIEEHEAWTEYMRASLASEEAWLRWALIRGDEGIVRSARECVASSRATLSLAEQTLAAARQLAEATVICSAGLHETKPGEDCPHCGENPKCAGCPSKEG